MNPSSVPYKLSSSVRYKKWMQKRVIVYMPLSFFLIIIKYSCNVRSHLWTDGLYSYMDMSGTVCILENTHNSVADADVTIFQLKLFIINRQ
jgi:hypothetical protein